MKSSDLYWQSYLNIEDEVLSLSRLILFTDGSSSDLSFSIGFDVPDQMSTCSDYIADLIVRCATQIESLMKTIYSKVRNDYGLPSTFESDKYKKDPTNLGFNGPCYELINSAFHVEDVVVQVNQSQFDLKKDENVYLKPLSEKAIKSSKDGWGRAYQNLKHNRIQSLKYGNLGNLLNACAALYLLNIYLKYYDEPAIHSSRNNFKNESFSFGSKIFSLVKPKIANELEYKNVPAQTIESPFVIRYGDRNFADIHSKQVECDKRWSDYVRSFKEFNSPGFNAYFKDIQTKNPNDKYDYFTELMKYRIKNKVNKGTTFEEKKNLLVTSDEWKSVERSITPPLQVEDVTEETLDKMIDTSGLLFARCAEISVVHRPFIDYAYSVNFDLVILPDTTGWDKNK